MSVDHKRMCPIQFHSLLFFLDLTRHIINQSDFISVQNSMQYYIQFPPKRITGFLEIYKELLYCPILFQLCSSISQLQNV